MTEENSKRAASFDAPEGDIKKAKVDEEIPERKGIAYIKSEYIVDSKNDSSTAIIDDDRAEASGDRTGGNNEKNRKKKRGQNKNREIKQTQEANKLCYALVDPDLGKSCEYGEGNCRYIHDLGYYLTLKGPDIQGVCPVFEALGYCPSGFKCRFLQSHFDKESTKLLKNLSKFEEVKTQNHEVNAVTSEQKKALIKRQFDFKLADKVTKIMDEIQDDNRKKDAEKKKIKDEKKSDAEPASNPQSVVKDNYNEYFESKFYASEKKNLDLVNKKIISPLTTVGNLPYRRLMKTLGADVTYSEMALALPLVQGTSSEWALPRAHISEIPGFGVQIAASKPWQASKAAEVLSTYCPQISELNLNSGCPIDLVYRQGSGSALLDQPARLIRVLNSMNYCSGEIPTTVKIRTGTRDGHPMAHNLVKRLVNETQTAAITLHGRSRQQRYTKEANWDYIAEVGQVLREAELETEEDKDRKDFQRINFVGNGDCYNFTDWYKAVENPYIDSVMIARGALIKPWILEEIDSQQYLDKSSTERLSIIEKYAGFAMEHWGTDEYGIATSRRYLCEFLSFFHRYIPYGILERYPIKLNERPKTWKGRNELETLLGSNDYKDWIKISEMFLGPAGEAFNFTPKHKSSS